MIYPGFSRKYNIFLVHFYICKKKNIFFYNFMGIIVKYFGCFYVYFFMVIILCIYVYIVMCNYLSVFMCIYAYKKS